MRPVKDMDPEWAKVVVRINGGGPGLEVLCGMIGSGKSTYARERAKNGAVVVCHDEIVKAFTPGKPYDSGDAEMWHAIEDAAVRAAIKQGRRVVIDRTNLTFGHRARWLGLAEDLRIAAALIVFPVESWEIHARRRFEHDPAGLELWQWNRIASRHEETLHRNPPPHPGGPLEGWQAVVAPDPTKDPLWSYATA